MRAAVAQAPLEGRRERKKRELRSRIYQTAQQLFLSQGFEATTVEQIAAAADIAPATFFNHFQSKNALLGEMTTEVFQHLQALIEQYLLRPGSAQERIISFADRAARDAYAARGVARDVVLELMRTRTRPGETPPYLERIFAPIAKTLRDGQRDGEVRSDLDAGFLAEMVLGALNAPFLNWMNDPNYPLEQRLRQAATFIGEAIQPLRPRPRRASPVTDMHSDLDILDAKNWGLDGHAKFRWLRENDPVHWDAKNAIWALSKYADVVYASKHHEIFCSGEGTRPNMPTKLSIVDMDEPRHGQLRSLINRGFKPRTVAGIEARFRQFTIDAIEKIARQGHCDFVRDIAVPMPIEVIADLIGIPKTDRNKLHHWSDTMIASDGNYDDAETMGKAAIAFAEYVAYIEDTIDARRKNPQDDLISILVTARDGGLLGETEVVDAAKMPSEHATEMAKDELTMFLVTLLIAGNETTRNALSGGISQLIENPDERQKLIDNPALIPTAVEEIVRYISPVLNFARTATQDTELQGRKIAKGEKILLMYPSANRDADVFTDPDAFKVDRDPNPHVAFGIGNHFCLGANLARMEIRVVLEELLTRLPDMEYSDGPPVMHPSLLVRSFTRMPVRFTPAA